MGRKPIVDRSPGEEWQILKEGINSGDVAEKSRRQAYVGNKGSLPQLENKLGCSGPACFIGKFSARGQ